jgi:sigma-B regulation protein RsbU (phosphoserine phosphatase)
MAQANALLRAAARTGDSPAQIVRRANRLLVQMNSSGQFVTVLYGILHLISGKFEYARAGHELPILIDSQGESKVAPHQDGIVMGFFEDLLLDEGEITISPDELLLIYTDGVTDGLREGSSESGIDRLRTIACDAPRLSAQDFCETIYQTIIIAQDGKPQFDDITLVAIRAASHL